MATLNVYVKDRTTGLGVGTARVTGLTKNQIIDPPVRQVSGDGGANLYFNGPGFNPPIAVTLLVDAPGYNPASTNDKPIMFGTSDINYEILLDTSPFKVAPISKDQFRAMNLKGNFGGQVLPGLGLSKNNSLFDPMIPWYSEPVQQAIFAAKRAAGLNTIGLCTWADYHGDEFNMPVRYDWCTDPAAARAYCIKLRRLGFIPFFWLLGDRVAGDQWDASGANCDNALALIALVLPYVKDVVGAGCPGFELRGAGDNCPYSAAQYWKMLILMNQIAPNLYKPGHFVSENSAGSSHSPVDAQDPWHGDEIFFWTGTNWTEGSTLLDGIFYQAPTGDKLFGPEGNWRDRWQEMIERIGRDNRRWPPACTDVDLIWGEAGWYDITRGDNTEPQIIAVSAEALAMGGKWSFSG